MAVYTWPRLLSAADAACRDKREKVSTSPHKNKSDGLSPRNQPQRAILDKTCDYQLEIRSLQLYTHQGSSGGGSSYGERAVLRFSLFSETHGVCACLGKGERQHCKDAETPERNRESESRQTLALLPPAHSELMSA